MSFSGFSDSKQMQQIENTILEEQVVEWVTEGAQVTEVHKTFQDIINPEFVDDSQETA